MTPSQQHSDIAGHIREMPIVCPCEEPQLPQTPLKTGKLAVIDLILIGRLLYFSGKEMKSKG